MLVVVTIPASLAPVISRKAYPRASISVFPEIERSACIPLASERDLRLSSAGSDQHFWWGSEWPTWMAAESAIDWWNLDERGW